MGRGIKQKTNGGLQKKDLKKNKSGKVVSVKQSNQGKKAWKHISKWHGACQKARKALGIKGFCTIGGKSKQGQTFLAKARSTSSKWTAFLAVGTFPSRRLLGLKPGMM